MGCCISRIKDRKNTPYEEEESSDNPLKILSVKGHSDKKATDHKNLIPKKKKIFERLDDTLGFKYKTSLGGVNLDLEDFQDLDQSCNDWDSYFFQDEDAMYRTEKAPKNVQ